LILVLIAVTMVTAPAILYSLEAKLQPIEKRLELNAAALSIFWQSPLIGAGLNNSSAVADDRQVVKTAPGAEPMIAVVHDYHLVMLIEVGLIGFILYFMFFLRVVMTAFRYMQAAATEMKALLISIVAALSSIAVHNLGDPFGGHAPRAMLWLYAGLIIAACRRVRASLPSIERSWPGYRGGFRPATASVTAYVLPDGGAAAGFAGLW
jgi:O-antigen ligase